MLLSTRLDCQHAWISCQVFRCTSHCLPAAPKCSKDAQPPASKHDHATLYYYQSSRGYALLVQVAEQNRWQTEPRLLDPDPQAVTDLQGITPQACSSQLAHAGTLGSAAPWTCPVLGTITKLLHDYLIVFVCSLISFQGGNRPYLTI